MCKNMCGRLNARSLNCTFLGFAQNESAYRLAHLIHGPSHHFIESHNIVLNEGGPTRHHIIILDHNSTPAMPDDNATALMPSPTPAPSITALHPRRTAHAPVRNDNSCYMDFGPQQTVHATTMAHTAAEDPRSYKAMACPDTTKWLATYKPMDGVPRLKDHKLNGSKWASHIKQGPKGETLKYNARVVMQGLMQIEGGVDEPFMLAAQPSCLHAAVVSATEFNLKAHKAGVKVAYPYKDKKENYISGTRERLCMLKTRPNSTPSIAKSTSHQIRLPLKSTSGPINAPSTQSSTPHLGLTPTFAHTVTTFDCHAANAGTKCARHSTTRLAPASHKQLATCLPTRHYWRPNLWAKRTLAALAMPGHTFTPGCTPPGLRGHVGVSAAGDV